MRSLTVDIDVINPRTGDQFGFEVTNDGVPLIFTQSGQVDSNGWNKTYVSSTQQTVPANRFIKLNTDLSYRPESATFSLFGNQVIEDFTINSFDTITAVGSFTLYNGSLSNRIVSFNELGPQAGIRTYGSGAGLPINSVYEAPDGSFMYVGGSFTSFNGATVNRFCKILGNGNNDTTFNNAIMSASTNKGFNGQVYTIAVQTNGKILVGGSFTRFNNNVANGIVRINPNGSFDSTFNMGTAFGQGGEPHVITIQPDGKILVGGIFSSYKGTTGCNGLVRLNANGTLDNTFTQGGFNVGFNQYAIRAIHVLPSGDILVGGDFTLYKGNTRNGIVKINSTGTVDYNIFGTGVADIVNVRRVYDIKTLSTGEILIGGFFQSFNGQPRNNFVKLNADGSFHIDKIEFNDPVKKILVKGSFIYLAGQFTNATIGTTAVSNLYNIPLIAGGLTSSISKYGFNSGTGFNNNVFSIKETVDGGYLTCGQFTSYNGTTANRIVKLTATGSVDNSFNYGSGFAGINVPYLIADTFDGGYLIGGGFSSYKGVSASGIIKLTATGSIDTSFNYGSGFFNSVANTIIYFILPTDNNSYIIGGGFTSYKGATANRIVKLTATGSIDTSFNYGGSGFSTGSLDTLSSICKTNDNGYIITGRFTSYNGISRNNIIKLTATGSIDTSFVNNISLNNPTFNSIAQANNDNYIIVGNIVIGTQSYKTVKITATGSISTTFYKEPIAGSAFCIKRVDSNNYLISNFSTTYSGHQTKSLVLINDDGIVDTSFKSNISQNISFPNNPGIIYDLIKSNDSYLLCGGFGATDNVTTTNISKISSTGSLWPINNIIATSSIPAIRTEQVYSTYNNLVAYNTNPYGITYSLITEGSGITQSIDFSNSAPVGGTIISNGIIKIQGDNKAILYNVDGFSGITDTLIRIDEYGIIDNTFDVSSSYVSYPADIVLQPDGKMFILNDDIYVRLNNDGTPDLYFDEISIYPKILYPITNNSHYLANDTTLTKINTFSGTYSIDTTFGYDGSVYVDVGFNSLIRQGDKLLFSISSTSSITTKGGTFSKGAGVYRLNIDGSFDNTFNYMSTKIPVSLNIGLSSTPGMVIDRNGMIMVPVYYDPTYITFIRLGKDGAVDTSYNFTTPIFNDCLTSITIQDDNKMILTGTTVGPSDESIVRYNTNGSIDITFNYLVTGYTKGIGRYNGTTDMLVIGENEWNSGNINITRIDKDGNEVLDIYEPALATGVRMIYSFDNDEVVLNDLYDTPNYVELTYTNTSLTINDLIQEVVVRSPHLIISTQSSFDTANYKIRIWEGSIFDGASQSVSYDITKQKLFLGQSNVYININNLVREKLEANVGNFFSTDYDFAKPLGENMSKWVQVDETLTNAGATVSTSKYRLFTTDGYLYNEEIQGVPNILLTGNQRYIYKDQIQRIYFQTNFLTRIQFRVEDGFADYDAYWNVDLLGDNKNYVQSLTVDTRNFPFGNNWVEYQFDYSTGETEIVRFNIYDYCKYQPFYLVFKNKWGVLESIGLTKKSMERLDTTNTQFERSILDYNGNYDINRHTKKQFNVTGEETWTLNTDWMPEYMNQAIEEVNLSEEVWLVDSNNTPYPVTIEDNSIDYKTEINDKLIQYTIKVKLSHSIIKNII